MIWLAYYYVVFFVLLYLVRNRFFGWHESSYDGFSDWCEEHIRLPWLRAIVGLFFKIGWYFALGIMHISIWSYVAVLLFSVSGTFLDRREMASDWNFYLMIGLLIIPLCLLVKLVYDQGYKKGLEKGLEKLKDQGRQG